MRETDEKRAGQEDSGPAEWADWLEDEARRMDAGEPPGVGAAMWLRFVARQLRNVDGPCDDCWGRE